VRGPLKTCPGCRITFAVPAAIAAARARRLDLAERYEPLVEYLALVVMRLPAWDAALDEVRAHIAWMRGNGDAAARFAAAARGFREAGQPLDAARCAALAADDAADGRHGVPGRPTGVLPVCAPPVYRGPARANELALPLTTSPSR
jgi:hypothetical protein